MSSKRAGILFSVLKGVIAASCLTLIGMLILALLTVFFRISDQLLLIINQFLKAVSILAGVCAAVGRGGSRGFVTGAVVALLYMLLGYLLYCGLGGEHSVSLMLGEMLMGVAIGAFTGAVLANMSPRKHRR